MKYFVVLAMVSGLFLNMGNTEMKDSLYQVVSSHPHDVVELDPYIETVHQSGRLWVVKLKDGHPEEIKQHLQLLSGGERSYFFQPSFSSMKKKKSFPRVILENVDKANIQKDVESLSNNYETRYRGTEENKKAVEDVSARFKALNYEVSQICYNSDSCSIVAEKKGKKTPGKVIMVEGHIDSVGESFAGADDNASGVAVILEMARVLKDVPTQKTLRFFISNGEEGGLLGAEHYAKTLKSKNEIKNLELVINMDMVGYNTNGVVELETDPNYEGLAKWYADLTARYTTLRPKITLGAWGSDHVPFLKRGVPSILTIEDWETKTPCYHMECDKPDTLNYDYTAEITKLNISAVLTKDLDQ